MDDDLGMMVRLRLKQHWVEVRTRLDSGGHCLERLCPPDLSAPRTDGGLVGHVLGLEGRCVNASLAGESAKPRHN